MPKKAITHKIPKEQLHQSIDTLCVRQSVLDYLHENDFKTIQDIVRRQESIPKEHRGAIYAYLIFGVKS